MGRTSSNLVTYYNSLPSSARIIFSEMVKSPAMNALYRNKKGFIENSTVVSFSSDIWKSNPQQFCKDYYNDQYLYPIILIVNNLGSIYEFRKDNLPNGIISPIKDVIFKILSQLKTIEDVENG